MTTLARNWKVLGLVALGALSLVLGLGVWIVAMEPVTLSGHAMDVDAVAFSPDGNILASGCDDGTVKLWDVRTRKEVAALEPPEGRYLGHDASKGTVYDPVFGKRPPKVNSLAFAPDGKTLAVGAGDDTMRLWDLGTKKQTLKIQLEPSGPFGRGNDVRSVAFTPDGKTVVSASDDGVIRLWSAETGKLVRALKGHTDMIYQVAISHDGKVLASGSADKTIRLWETASGDLKSTITGHADYVRSVAFSPDGKYVVGGAGDVLQTPPVIEVKLWDVSSGKEVADFKGHKGMVMSVAFSPDGKLLASGGGNSYRKLGEVIIWDVAKRQPITRHTNHADIVHSVAFSPDGKWLASGSEDKTVKVWDVRQLAKPE